MKYKQLFLSPLSLIPVGLQPAVAADMPVKAPQVTSWTPSWAGFYAGLNVGALSESSRLSAFQPPNGFGVAGYCWVGNCNFGTTPKAVGVLGGLQVGYNVQSGNIVYGFETDFGLSSARQSSSGTGNFGYSYTANTGIDAFGTARLRLGYAFDNRAMVYTTGGLAFAQVRDSFQQGTGYSWTSTGWRTGYAVGGGLEYMFDAKWSIKGEALYYDLGSKDHISSANLFGGTENSGLTDRMTGWVGRVGLNYLFH